MQTCVYVTPPMLFVKLIIKKLVGSSFSCVSVDASDLSSDTKDEVLDEVISDEDEEVEPERLLIIVSYVGFGTILKKNKPI